MLRDAILASRAAYEAVVGIQGLGFVGTAMATAVASARRPDGSRRFLVVGVDQDTSVGRARVSSIAEGALPFPTMDVSLQDSLRSAVERGNLMVTTDPSVFALVDVAVVDIHLDVDFTTRPPSADLTPFSSAIRTLADQMPAGSLILIETTVPPGTTLNVVVPLVATALRERGLPPDAIHVAHSYERVMPGPDYLNSIIHYWRVFAGVDEASAVACASFLEAVIDVEHYPLTQLPSPTASEMAKILENSYRAVNIAFVDEWGRFAEEVGVDLYEVVEAIRMRPTHSNIREPGLGVGGYCLTKDPLFPLVSLKQFFPEVNVRFPVTMQAVDINARMPLVTAERLRQLLGGSLAGKSVLIMGASYRSDLGDTRYSPSETLVRALMDEGVSVRVHDPIATDWAVDDVPIESARPAVDGFDAIVFAVAHSSFASMDLYAWLGTHEPWLLDSNHVLTPNQRGALADGRYPRLFSIGRGPS